MIRTLALVFLTIASTAYAQNPKLEQVLTQMDQASQRFKSATADFSWDQYQKVVDEHDTQSGKIYFRRSGKETQMAADIDKPTAKKLVYSGGKVQFYQPSINQLTIKDAGTNRADVESFLVLGFGGPGHDLLKQWNVTYAGDESINGTQTAKLELTPKAENIRHMFSKVIIWVDPKQDVSLKQQTFEPSGDNRTATYTNFKLNANINSDAFKIKTNSSTRTVR